jgi:hypothetical protein
MVIGFGQKLHASGFGQLLEGSQDIGAMAVKLLQTGTCNGKCHFKPAFIFQNQLMEKAVNRQIANVGNPVQDFDIQGSRLIQMIVAYPEEAVVFEPVRLMDLEIKANSSHAIGFPFRAQCYVLLARLA